MEQHPVPQQISAYHFRLIGDMTIKQFIELLAGIVAAWVSYSLPISPIFRWPMVIFSVFLGVAFAFLPIEERPLDRWLFAFIKASYSPTKFLWRKKIKIPSFFEEIKVHRQTTQKREEVDRSKLEKYLQTLPAQGLSTNLDDKESRFVSEIMKIYLEVQPTTQKTIKPKKIIAEFRDRIPKVIVRKLKTPPTDPHAISRGEVIMPKRATTKPKIVNIPEEKPIKIDKIPEPLLPSSLQESLKPLKPEYDLSGITALGSTIRPKTQPAQLSTEAILKPTLPIPAPPSQPNVLVGMVTDSQGNIVENAIITIKEVGGNVARAQKTNKIGQFFIATPLNNGHYEIEVEREGLSFAIIKIELSGKPIQPLEIKAK